MAIPLNAFQFKAPMDPAERLDYQIKLKSGELTLLESTELIASYTLTLYPEAIALGMSVMSTGSYAPSDDGESIKVWFEFNASYYTNAAFSGTGSVLAMELTVVTNSVPARTRQRTVTLGVLQL